MYIAAPVVPMVVIHRAENKTLSLNCSNLITVRQEVLGQMWLDSKMIAASNSSSYSIFRVTREAAGCYVCVTYLVPNSNGVTSINSSTMVVIYCTFISVSALIVFG